jgi:hypothetical protein
MGMGVLVIIAGIVRLIRTIAELDNKTEAYDVPFASYDVVIWSSVEVCTGLVCAAAPATRLLVRLIALGLLANEESDDSDNTAARRRNYADGTANIGKFGSKGTGVTGQSGSSTGNGSQELWDLGRLLKNDTGLARLKRFKEIQFFIILIPFSCS